MPADCTAEEIKDLGKQLLIQGSVANFRAGLGRLYFANFLKARDKALVIGANIKASSDDHGAIVSALKKRNKMGIVRILEQLRTYRRHADYHFPEAVDKKSDCPLCSGRVQNTPQACKTIADDADICFKLITSL